METITVSEGEVVGAQSNEVIDASNPTISVVHMSIPNQPVQVQSVIHGNHPGVIQTAGGTIQTIQVPITTVGSDGDAGSALEDDDKKRREILARRPSYRKILNELSADPPSIAKIEEESNSSQDSQEISDATNNLTSSGHTIGNEHFQHHSVIPAGAIQVAGQGDGATGLHTLTMTNSNANSAPQGATIVQYAQGPDGQFFIPAGSVQAYQISTPTSLPQGVVMAAAGTTITSPQQLTEEASRKRELRLLKNREAAKECRRKKKEYVKCLENRVAVLENQNKTLIEELKSLKELYCQKEG